MSVTFDLESALLKRRIQLSRTFERHMFEFVTIVHSVIAYSVFTTLFLYVKQLYNHLESVPRTIGVSLITTPSQWLVTMPFVERAALAVFTALIWVAYYLTVAALRAFSERYSSRGFCFDLAQAVMIYFLAESMRPHDKQPLPPSYAPWLMSYAVSLGLVLRILEGVRHISEYPENRSWDSLNYIRWLNRLIPLVLHGAACSSVCFAGWWMRANEGDLRSEVNALYLGVMHFNAVVVVLFLLLKTLHRHARRNTEQGIDRYLGQVWRRWRTVTHLLLFLLAIAVMVGRYYEDMLWSLALAFRGGSPLSVLLVITATGPIAIGAVGSRTASVWRAAKSRLYRVPVGLEMLFHTCVDYWLHRFKLPATVVLLHLPEGTEPAKLIDSSRRLKRAERQAFAAFGPSLAGLKWLDDEQPVIQSGETRTRLGSDDPAPPGTEYFVALAPFFRGPPTAPEASGVIIATVTPDDAEALEDPEFQRHFKRMCKLFNSSHQAQWSRLRDGLG